MKTGDGLDEDLREKETIRYTGSPGCTVKYMSRGD